MDSSISAISSTSTSTPTSTTSTTPEPPPASQVDQFNSVLNGQASASSRVEKDFDPSTSSVDLSPHIEGTTSTTSPQQTTNPAATTDSATQQTTTPTTSTQQTTTPTTTATTQPTQTPDPNDVVPEGHVLSENQFNDYNSRTQSNPLTTDQQNALDKEKEIRWAIGEIFNAMNELFHPGSPIKPSSSIDFSNFGASG